MAEVLDFQIVVKRINKRQINRANPSLSSEEPEYYFRVTICIPYIPHKPTRAQILRAP